MLTAGARIASTARVLLALGFGALFYDGATAPVRSPYIVEAHGKVSAAAAVRRAGGRVTRDLPIIDGVAALLSPMQAAWLRRDASLALFADTAVVPQGANPIIDQYARIEVAADKLGAQGIFGNGVNKILKQYNAITNQVGDSGSATAADDYGHGSPDTSIDRAVRLPARCRQADPTRFRATGVSVGAVG